MNKMMPLGLGEHLITGNGVIFLVQSKMVRVGFDAKEQFSAGSGERLIVFLDYGTVCRRGLFDPTFRKVYMR